MRAAREIALTFFDSANVLSRLIDLSFTQQSTKANTQLVRKTGTEDQFMTDSPYNAEFAAFYQGLLAGTRRSAPVVLDLCFREFL